MRKGSKSESLAKHTILDLHSQVREMQVYNYGKRMGGYKECLKPS